MIDKSGSVFLEGAFYARVAEQGHACFDRPVHSSALGAEVTVDLDRLSGHAVVCNRIHRRRSLVAEVAECLRNLHTVMVLQ
jgi:hypothetical protein